MSPTPRWRPCSAPDGRTLGARRWYDTEALTRDGDTLYVAIERVHRIVRFDYGKDGLRARGQPIEVPAAFRSLPSNGSIESLVFMPRGTPLGGTLIAISERGRDEAGDHRAFLIGGPRPGTFTIKRKDAYDISDATLVSVDDLLILERKFGWTTGLFIRIRRMRDDIRPARWSTVRRCSRPTSVSRSTTWKASAPTALPAARPC